MGAEFAKQRITRPLFVQSMPSLGQNAKNVEGYIRQKKNVVGWGMLKIMLKEKS
jgi:hypothetical protein